MWAWRGERARRVIPPRETTSPMSRFYADGMSSMTHPGNGSPRERIRPLLHTRQVREYTHEPLAPDVLDAIVDAARWSGSSQNEQPWRFIVIRDEAALRRLAEAGQPQTRPLNSATSAVAIVLPDEKGRAISRAYDEGRAAERMLVAASMLGVAAGISWVLPGVVQSVRDILGVPADHIVRTIVALGHPTDAALRPKSAAGQARLPRQQVVFEERWQNR